MKKDIHPSSYREVVFKDMSNDDKFMSRYGNRKKAGK